MNNIILSNTGKLELSSNNKIFLKTNINSLKTNLISCWELNEKNGNIAYDSNNLHNLTKTKNVLINQVGILDTCYYFPNDANSNCYVDNHIDFNPISKITLSAWVNSSGGNIGGQGIICKNPGTSYQYILYMTTDTSAIQMIIRNTDNTVRWAGYNTNTTKWFVDKWCHLVGTYDRTLTTDRIKIYLNGELKGVNNGVDLDIITNTGVLRIGSWRDFGNAHFNGYIDQTAIWSDALTQQQISVLYNSGQGLPYSSW